MASLKRIWTMSLACGALLLCGRAVAQAPVATAGYTDIFADKADRDEAAHTTVYTGAVEVVQSNGSRLNCDTLTVVTYGPGEGPNAPKPGQPPAPKGATEADATSSDNIKQMIAEGHVYYVTQNETVKGDHGLYDADADVITVTGNVIAVQGKNVARGDKLVMDRKTNHTTMVSEGTGRNNPNRVRGVFYSAGRETQGQTNLLTGKTEVKKGQAQKDQAQKDQAQKDQVQKDQGGQGQAGLGQAPTRQP